jgi:hypothetical protein
MTREESSSIRCHSLFAILLIFALTFSLVSAGILNANTTIGMPRNLSEPLKEVAEEEEEAVVKAMEVIVQTVKIP